MSENGYQGWANFTTWIIALWLSNDEGTYKLMCDYADDAKENDDPQLVLAEIIEHYVRANNPVADTASMWNDIMGRALGSVDWLSIASGYLE